MLNKKKTDVEDFDQPQLMTTREKHKQKNPAFLAQFVGKTSQSYNVVDSGGLYNMTHLFRKCSTIYTR